MRKLTLLIGVPGSGKSTYINKNVDIVNDIVISRDDIVDELRKEYGYTYSESFHDQNFQNLVNVELKSRIDNAFNSSKNIVIDMTNMNKSSRSKFLVRGKDFYKEAIVFNIDRDEVINRLKKRESETGKHISDNVLNAMYERYEEPDNNEFENIIYITE